MKKARHPRAAFTAMCLSVLSAVAPSVEAAPPDLTAAGAIVALKANTLANANPTYGETYNLGATGLRGWIYIGGGNGADGTITTESRQILVTVASAPGSAVLAVDDVILGAMAGSSGTVPAFSSDARKVFGVAIGDAEKTGVGTLRVKRWRSGTTTDVNIPMTIMGNYTATAPYNCPKSALILANARTKLVAQLLADSNFLTNDWKGASNGLALLAGVAPGDANYATVQTRLQTYARGLAATTPNPTGLYTWDWGYIGVFLGEYSLNTGDVSVLAGLNNYTVALAKAQSRYGTFGHGGSILKADGSLHGTIPPYGPVNQAGLPANLAIVMGKKALVAAGQTIDPEIDPAIQRGSDFFAWYVNKGGIPYGEHEPNYNNHGSNGKDPMCAVLFGLQAGRTVETEFFSRMTTAGFNGREYGHTGQGFSYLWSAMGANMGGALAVAEYLKPVRWHLDLERRTDGSFAYDGAEQYGAGRTSDGTYLGASGYYDLNPTACYILTYSLPLQRLYITGKNAIPANTLDAAKVTNAIAAATFNVDCPGFTNTQLIAALSEYDPVVRNYAAIELAKNTPALTTPELTTLRNMVTGTDANARMAACQALAILKDATALPLIVQRLDKNIETNSWVRAKAARALRRYDFTATSPHRDLALTAFIANATDPEAIIWDDPLQRSNSELSFCLFGGWDETQEAVPTFATISAPKSLLYPAVKTGLKQPDSLSRGGAANYSYNSLTLPDVQALIPDIIEVAWTVCQADTMWYAGSRAQGIHTLAKYHISEGIPLALAMQEPSAYGLSGEVLDSSLNALASYGDAARWTLPTLRGYLTTLDPAWSQYTTLVNTIATIESAITAPTLVPGFAVANPQVVVTTAAKAVTLTGSSPRGTAVTFSNVSTPAHGTLTGTAPNLIYTPTSGYTGPDSFTFQTNDVLTNSAPGTVSIIVGTAGTGLKGDYYDNINFTNLKLTRTDAQVNFDWGTGSPSALLGADTFSVRWSGLLLVPETATYQFSTLNSDGVRLYINGVPVINDYTDQTTNWVDGGSVNLTAGQLVEIQMEYYENTGSAVAKLKWTGPSFAGANGLPIAKEWLFDGTGMTRTPYAHAQSVNQIQNTAQAILLQGSGGTLTYSVLTQPAHGTLTGTAPNLTYTPATNYNGSDSFTFLVNNGTSNSAPATVSIGIQAGLPVNYTWLNAASGNWSLAGNWTSGAAPAATGQPYYNLNFTPAGTYTVTHDLNNGFQLNQLNVEGAVTIAGTNSLAFTANGTILPQFNQNSSSGVAINTPVSLSAMTTFGGSNAGTVSLSSLISGTGGLAIGSHGITAQYAGNATNAASTSAAVTIQITSVLPPVPANLFAAPGINNINLTWTTSAGAASYYVKRSLANGGPYTVIGNSNTASYVDLTAVNGTPYYYVVSALNASGESANSAQVSAIPAIFPSTTTVTSLLGNAATYGTAVTFTATVAVSGGPATGTVTFKDGATVLGTGTLDGAGAATFASGTLAVGSHTITATYGGDTTFGPSVSPGFSYVVSAKSLTITGVIASTKSYDGTATATLTGGTLSGVLGGDTVTLIPGTATFASPNAGTWPVTATGFALGGTHAGNYVLSAQPTLADATITLRPVQLTGTRAYDGTALAAGWGIANNINGANLAVTGSATLVGKDVGSQGILVSHATPARVRSATGTTGTTAAATISVTMAAAPFSGNTMVAVISTRGTSAGRVTGITQTGATWSRVAEAANANNTTEIWMAPNVSGAGTGITINQASLISAAVVIEYSGILAVSALDQISSATGTNTAAVTGTTPTTTQASELWIGGIGIADGRRTLNAPYGSSFTVVASPNTSAVNTGAMIYALEKIVSATGAASSGGTVSISDSWSGAIATFKAAQNHTLALTGAAAGNYTLAGVTGAMTITPKALTLTTKPAVTGKTYDGLSSATLTGAALPSVQAPGTGTTSDGTPYTGDLVSLTLSGTFTTKDAAIGKAVTSTSTLTGVQKDNYTLTQPTGLTGTITPKELAVTANDQSKTYGQSVTFGSGSTLFTSSGLLGGETIGSVTLACAGGGAAAAVASYPITPGAATGGTFTAANYAIDYLPGILTVTPVNYEAWAADVAQGLTAGLNDGPADDPDHDGISNLLEFVLGGAPMVSSQAILPVLSHTGGGWVFEYERNSLSKTSTTQVVEYGSDLSGWNPLPIPETTAAPVTITPSASSDHVKVTIPNPGTQGFVRLKVSQ